MIDTTAKKSPPKSYYTEDDEESKLLVQTRQKRSSKSFGRHEESKVGYRSMNEGHLEYNDLEAGNQINSHNVNAARRSGINRQEFDDLNLNRSEDELSVISFEQVNQSHFFVFAFLRPLFWLAYYLFCCCLISNWGGEQ